MSGWEAYGHLTDVYDEMDVSGVEPTPGALARHAFGWVEAPRIELRLRHPDESLLVRPSGWPFRRRPGEPDLVTRPR